MVMVTDMVMVMVVVTEIVIVMVILRVIAMVIVKMLHSKGLKLDYHHQAGLSLSLWSKWVCPIWRGLLLVARSLWHARYCSIVIVVVSLSEGKVAPALWRVECRAGRSAGRGEAHARHDVTTAQPIRYRSVCVVYALDRVVDPRSRGPNVLSLSLERSLQRDARQRLTT